MKYKLIHRNFDAVAITMYFLLSVIVIRKLLSFPGILFFNEVGIPPFPSMLLQNAKFLFAWNENDFGSIIVRQTSMYTRFIQILTGMVGLDGAKVTILFIMINLGLSGYSIFYLTKTLGLPKTASFLSGLFYMLNPLLFHEIIYGHIPDFIFAYSSFPFLLSLLTKSFNEGKYSVLFSIIIFVPFATATVHMLFFAIIIPPLFLLVTCKGNLRRKMVWTSVYIMLVLSVQFPWIFSNLSSTYKRLQVGGEVYGFSRTAYLSAAPYQAWINIGYAERDFSEKIGTNLLGNLWYIFGYAITIFSLMCLLMNPKERKALFFSSLLLLVIGIMFIFKTPLGVYFYNLYSLIPMISVLFRDPTRFAYLHALASSILLGFSFIYLQQKSKKFAKRYLIVAGLLALLIFSFGIPFLTGDLGGYFRPYDYEPYNDMVNYLKEHEPAGRVIFYYPDVHVRYDPANSLWKEEPRHWSVDAITNFFPWPTISLRSEDRTSPSYFLPLYVYYTMVEEDSEALAKLLGNLNAEYVIVRKNVSSPLERFSSIKVSPQQVEDKLLQSDDFILVKRINDDITIFKNIKARSKFSIASTIYFSDYRDLKDLLELGRNYAIIFPPLQFPLNGSFIENVLIEDLSGKSFILSFIPTDNIILPSQYVKDFNPSLYFVPYFYEPSWLRNPYFSRFAHPFSIMGIYENVTIDIPLKASFEDDFYLAVNYLQEKEQNSIRVEIGDYVYHLTRNDGSKPSWEILGPFKLHNTECTLKLVNEKGVNLINYMLLSSKQNLDEANLVASAFLQNKTIRYLLIKNENLTKKAVTLNILKSGNYSLCFDYLLQDPVRLQITVNGCSYFLELAKGEHSICSPNINFNRTGEHLLTFKSLANNIVPNGSFEAGYMGWKIPASIVFETLLCEDGIDGNYSLRVSTNTSTTNTWSWIRSETINVNPGEEYLIVTSMKYTNVIASHIVIEGYFENENTWKQLVQVPRGKSGTADWQKFTGYLTIPENVTRIRAVLNAGWVENPGKGNATTRFDSIGIFPTSQIPYVEESILVSGDTPIADEPAQIFNYTKIDPTKYMVKVNATKPFMLSFAESYDPLWTAYVNGEKIQSIPLYGVINGFWINQTGLLDIVIEYEPQRWFYIGSAISLTTLIACTTYLTLSHPKTKNQLKKLKQKLYGGKTPINQKPNQKYSQTNQTLHTIKRK